MKTKSGGFTLVEIMIVVAIIGLLATMAMPAYVRARGNSQESVCLNNLRVINTAKAQHVWDAKRVNGDTLSPTSLDPYLKKPLSAYVEPSGGRYEVRVVGEDPICTFGGSHTL
jgi:prepilin-type N-terminal cleavage/methylation domain-containing protein